MSEYTFGKLTIDPVKNPGVIDTGTWDVEAIKRWAKQITPEFCAQIRDSASSGDPEAAPSCGGMVSFASSTAVHDGAVYSLLAFPDGQKAFIQLYAQRNEQLAGPICSCEQPEGKQAVLFPADAGNIHQFVRRIHKRKGPKALGPIPRLGIGVRHTTTLWPGIWNAMYKGDFSGNPIQNSVRELHLLDTLTEGIPSRTNHLFSVGPVKEGHTGSTFEGLWTEGVLHDLQHPRTLRYGADADHLQVKRGSEGIDRTKQFIQASRYYSFYTLDVSDILEYHALNTFGSGASAEYLERCIPNERERSEVLWYHRQKKSLGKQYVSMDEAMIGRMVGKYWHALQAIEDLCLYIDSLKDGEPYDLELSVDENPSFVRTFDTITTPQELLFLLDEIDRRMLPVTHVAPNFGVEKCTDYRGDDGKGMFEKRLEVLHRISSEKHVMLDCHSGDDLSRDTRQIFRRATRGNIHFKISPSLQTLYGKVLSEVEPELFAFWWKDTLEYVKSCAAEGYATARYALSLLERSGDTHSGADHFFFKEFCFATLGKRDEQGNYIYRDRFYDLSGDFYEEMERRTEGFILEAAEDLFHLQ